MVGKRRLDGYHGDFLGASSFNSDLEKAEFANIGVLKTDTKVCDISSL